MLKYIIIKFFNVSEHNRIIQEINMSRKEFVRLLEANIWSFSKLADKIRMERAELTDYPRQLTYILVRLHQGGAARLKDIAQREQISAPNLCAAFRKLEQDGYVVRTIDENDRRNTWYCVSPSGAELALKSIDLFRISIEKIFANISKEDEARLTDALRTMKDVLNNMEINNA